MANPFRLTLFLALGGLTLIAPSASAEPRRDLSGDPLPPDAIARIGTVRWRHVDQFGASIDVVPSPTGELVATVDRADSAKVVRVWELSDGRPVCELPWPDTVSGRGLQFAPDGTRVMVLGPRGVVKFYDSRTGKLLAESMPAVEKDDVQPPSISSGRWSETQHALTADGRWVVTRQGLKNVSLTLTEIVTDPGARPQPVTLDRPTGDVSIHGVGHGNTLVGSRHSGQRFEILRWNVRTGKLVRTTPIQSKVWRLADWTRDGKRVALWGDEPSPNKVLRVWDTETGNQVIALEGLEFNWGSVRLSPGGKHLIANTEQNEKSSTVALWDVDRGKVIGRLQLPAWCNEFHLLPDSKTVLAVDSVGMMFGTWDIATGRRLSAVAGHESKLQHLAFASDGKSLLTASVDSAEPIMAWDAATGKMLRELSVSHGPPRRNHWGWWQACPSFALSPGGVVVTTRDATLIWSDSTSGRELRRASTKRFSPKDEYSVQEERVSLTIDPQTGRLAVVGLHTFGHSPYASVSAEDGWKDVITLWDLDSGKLIAHRVSARSFPDPPALVSPDGRLLVRQFYEYWGGQAPTGKTVLIEQFAGRGGIKLHPPDDLSPHFALTPDSQTLITLTTKRPNGNETGLPAGASTIRLWEVRTGRERLEFTLPFTVPALGKAARLEPFALAVSPNGRFLASVWSDNVIRLWDLATGTELATRRGYWAQAHMVAFRPDCKALASGHVDGTALVWDLSGLPEVKPATADHDAAWKDLASADAAKAYRAILALAGDPDSVMFLRDNVKPEPAVPAKQFEKLVKDLDHDKYAMREAATAALKKMGELVDAELQALLRGELTAEQRRRIVDVIESLQLTAESDPDRLRALRCVEVLEQIGSAEARTLLGELAKGAPGARLTRDAAGAIRRGNTQSR